MWKCLVLVEGGLGLPCPVNVREESEFFLAFEDSSILNNARGAESTSPQTP